MADVTVVFVEISLGVETLDVIRAVAESFENVVSDSGHDKHIENDVNGVCELDAVLREIGAYDAHGVGNDIHCSALHGAAVKLCELLVAFLGIHPVVDVSGVFLLRCADEGSSFNTCNVVYCCAVEIASGELFFVELDHLTRGAGFISECVCLFLASVDPNDLVGCAEGSHLIYPVEYMLVGCYHNKISFI